MRLVVMTPATFDDALDLPLNVGERAAAQLVGVEAQYLEQLWWAIFGLPDSASPSPERSVLLGIVAAAALRASIDGGVGAIELVERSVTERVEGWERTPVGEVLISLGMKPTAFMPLLADAIVHAVSVSAEAVAIDRVRRNV